MGEVTCGSCAASWRAKPGRTRHVASARSGATGGVRGRSRAGSISGAFGTAGVPATGADHEGTAAAKHSVNPRTKAGVRRAVMEKNTAAEPNGPAAEREARTHAGREAENSVGPDASGGYQPTDERVPCLVICFSSSHTARPSFTVVSESWKVYVTCFTLPACARSSSNLPESV